MYSELHGFLLSYDICILYIFTSLFLSHNHPIREAGQLLADKRIESRGAGWPADLSGLQALWDQQGPAASPKAKGLLGPAGVRAERGRGECLLFSPSSFLPQLFTVYPLYARHCASCWLSTGG